MYFGVETKVLVAAKSICCSREELNRRRQPFFGGTGLGLFFHYFKLVTAYWRMFLMKPTPSSPIPKLLILNGGQGRT